jgi:hypothetical protein
MDLRLLGLRASGPRRCRSPGTTPTGHPREGGWAIDASTDTSTASLASGVLDTNGSVGFALSTAVAEGDFLYSSVDPNGNAICDTTFLDPTISGPLKED